MTYQDLLRAVGSAEKAHEAARTALIPYIRDGRNAAECRAHLIAHNCCPPWLLNVPRRVLKRWATRAIKTGVPRGKRLTGPRLAMARRNTMHPSFRGFLP